MWSTGTDRVHDCSVCMSLIRYCCKVSYIGARYSGWQSQKDGSGIQDQVESALHHICPEKVFVVASGRTDAKVNARQQVFHFDTSRDMADKKWIPAINTFLPEDIHVTEVHRVPFTFHARHTVRWKRYTYRIHTGMYDVFSKDVAYQCPIPLDFAKMQEASKYFVGTHDFTTFNSSSLKEYPDQVRTIFSVDCVQNGQDISLTFKGKGFLRYMVRMMSAALIEVGKGKMSPEEIPVLLEKKCKTAAHRNADAHGLTLEEVKYFEVLALSETGMIREYMHSDSLPEGKNIETLEKEYDTHADTVYYVMTTRHEQTPLARIIVTEKGYAIEYMHEDGKVLFEELQEAFIKRIHEKGYDREGS